MDIAALYLEDIQSQFRKLKEQCERAIEQVSPAELLFREPAKDSNSVAKIAKHIAGNLRSRFTDFLHSDGEKPERRRDNEFSISAEDSWESIKKRWDEGWEILFSTLRSLHPQDLPLSVKIRGEAMPVLAALNRSFGHISYHSGQILYLCKLLTPEGWKWITIAPGKSEDFNKQMRDGKN